jgi:hypothetical protein
MLFLTVAANRILRRSFSGRASGGTELPSGSKDGRLSDIIQQSREKLNPFLVAEAKKDRLSAAAAGNGCRTIRKAIIFFDITGAMDYNLKLIQYNVAFRSRTGNEREK